ncbi:MAG: hypothetical protein A2V77_24835 [Anaeromyxobacter sp. RBG_16_69_14]|nr:MAG: hypothetical protein A2V77_24835 [Anaeromyxobacter sp. RBG_16_69_14]
MDWDRDPEKEEESCAMARISHKPKLPPSLHPIERVRCSVCHRSWAVYKDKIPRMWTAHGGGLFCDRRPCNAALDRARRTAKAG